MRALEEITSSVHELRRGGPVDRKRTKSVIDSALLMEWRPSVGSSYWQSSSKSSSASTSSTEKRQSALAVMRRRITVAIQRRRDRAFEEAVHQFSQGLFCDASEKRHKRVRGTRCFTGVRCQNTPSATVTVSLTRQSTPHRSGLHGGRNSSSDANSVECVMVLSARAVLPPLHRVPVK